MASRTGARAVARPGEFSIEPAPHYAFPMLRRIAEGLTGRSGAQSRSGANGARTRSSQRGVVRDTTPVCTGRLAFSGGSPAVPPDPRTLISPVCFRRVRILAGVQAHYDHPPRAFDRIHCAAPHSVLLLAGDFVSQDLARAAEPLLGVSGVLRLRHLPEREFWLAASAEWTPALGCGIPRGRRPPGFSVQPLMGRIAKPASMVTLGEETERYADTDCFRIPARLPEKASLTEHKYLSCVTSADRRGKSANGEPGHIHSFHSLERVAELYWETLCAHRC